MWFLNVGTGESPKFELTKNQLPRKCQNDLDALMQESEQETQIKVVNSERKMAKKEYELWMSAF